MSKRTKEAFPSIPMSKLLKSWAMPPAKVPIASIFCEW